MEEQNERHNPVNPKNVLHNRRETAMRNVGAGATPSMGLSQFRGGMNVDQGTLIMEAIAHRKIARADIMAKIGRARTASERNHLLRQLEQLTAEEVANEGKPPSGLRAEPDEGLSGSGTKKGQKRRTARKAYESESDEEAHDMGHHLGKHLLALHGGAFHKSFVKGMMRGGVTQDELDAALGLVKMNQPPAPAPAQTAPVAVTGAITTSTATPGRYDQHFGPARGRGGRRGAGRMCGGRRELDEIVHQPRSGLSVAEMRQQHNRNAREDYKRSNPITSAIGEYGMKGVNALTDLAIEHGSKVGVPPQVIEGIKKSRELAQGKGKTGAYEGQGKKRRSPAGANDGRRHRAEIVKRVMAEKGLKMIEASKYVKQHGLY